MAHVFISYSHDDSKFAEKLKEGLEVAGIDVWLDKLRLRAGEDWREEIDEAINASFALILCVSVSSLSSEYVNYEWAYAYRAQKKVIPIIIGRLNTAIQIPKRIQTIQYIEFPRRSEQSLGKLIRRLNEVKNVQIEDTPKSSLSHTHQMINALQSWNRDERELAAKALGEKHAVEAVPALIQALSDEDVAVRLVVAGALGNIGEATAVPHLITALHDEHPSVRHSAAEALGKIGDKRAIEGLLQALHDEYGMVRNPVAHAIIAIGVDASRVINLLDDQNPNVRAAAAWIIGSVGDSTVEAELIHSLADPDSSVRSHAAGALGSVGTNAAVPALAKLLTDFTSFTSLSGETYAKVRVCDVALNALETINTEEAHTIVEKWRQQQK